MLSVLFTAIGDFLNRFIVSYRGDPDRAGGVSHLELSQIGKSSDRGNTVIVSRRNGRVDVLNVDHGSVSVRVDGNALLQCKGSGACSSHMFESSDGGNKIVAVMECGNAGVFDIATSSSPHAVFEWTCPSKVASSAYHENSGLLAVGCQGAELKAYNIGTEEPSQSAVFAAKVGKPNNVGLCDRPWTSAVAFDPSAVEGNRILVGTGYYELRLYDSKVGKRPQLDVKFKDYKISRIVSERDGRRWWVADGGGNLQVYDVRAGKFDGAIKGTGGAIRDIDIRDNCIASVGLDRFVRLNSTSSRGSLAKVYVKSQMTGVCLLATKPVTDTTTETRKRPADNQRLTARSASTSQETSKVSSCFSRMPSRGSIDTTERVESVLSRPSSSRGIISEWIGKAAFDFNISSEHLMSGSIMVFEDSEATCPSA